MKCDRCDNEATVHEVLPKPGGKTIERHLCESCAKQVGVAIQNAAPITQILSQFLAAQAKSGAAVHAGAGTQVAICRACGTTYAAFRQTGLLGCPDCYRNFEAQLGPMLQRAHEGGTHHTGKSPAQTCAHGVHDETGAPAQSADQQLRAERAASLRKRLGDAVSAEQYEVAARLRDELTQIQPPQAAPRATKKEPPPPAAGRSEAGPDPAKE